MEKKQYRYLDLLKVIAISLVCMYHFWHGAPQDSQSFIGMLQKFVYSMLSTCVPLFFSVNGALLLCREDYSANKHFKKLLTIFLQYFVWHGITTVILGVAADIDFSSLYRDQLLNIFLFLGTPADVDLNHFWFIPILCGIYILYPFVKTVFDQEHRNHGSGISTISLLVILYFLHFFITDFSAFNKLSPELTYLELDPFLAFTPFGSRIGVMLTYFLIGGFLHRYRQKTRRIPAVVCILMMLAGLLLSYGMVTAKELQGETHFDIVFGGYGTTGTLLCTAGMFLLASRAEETIPTRGICAFVIQKISRNTMTIYYTHWIIGSTLLRIIPIGYGCFWNLLKTGLLIACGCVLGETMKRIPILKHLVHGS